MLDRILLRSATQTKKHRICAVNSKKVDHKVRNLTKSSENWYRQYKWPPLWFCDFCDDCCDFSLNHSSILFYKTFYSHVILDKCHMWVMPVRKSVWFPLKNERMISNWSRTSYLNTLHQGIQIQAAIFKLRPAHREIAVLPALCMLVKQQGARYRARLKGGG